MAAQNQTQLDAVGGDNVCVSEKKIRDRNCLLIPLANFLQPKKRRFPPLEVPLLWCCRYF